jgi:hypothetical protein
MTFSKLVFSFKVKTIATKLFAKLLLKLCLKFPWLLFQPIASKPVVDFQSLMIFTRHLANLYKLADSKYSPEPDLLYRTLTFTTPHVIFQFGMSLWMQYVKPESSLLNSIWLVVLQQISAKLFSTNQSHKISSRLHAMHLNLNRLNHSIEHFRPQVDVKLSKLTSAIRFTGPLWKLCFTIKVESSIFPLPKNSHSICSMLTAITQF